jgi:hypothetical protein
MFPHSNYLPSGIGQLLICVTVTSLVIPKLLFPPTTVRPRTRSVLRTRVPEAAVDHYGHPSWPEDDVSGSPQSRNGLSINSVAEPESMELGSKSQFGRCSMIPLQAHPVPDAWVGRGWTGHVANVPLVIV